MQESRSESMSAYSANAFQGLEAASLSDILAPVPLAMLRVVANRGVLGREMRRSYFRGFRIQVLSRERIIQEFSRVLSSQLSADLTKTLLKVWLDSVPAARGISRAVHGRDDPFAGPVSPEFYEQMASALPMQVLATIQKVIPPIANTKQEDRQVDVEEGSLAQTAPDLEVSDAEETSSPTESEVALCARDFADPVRTFNSTAERDAWWWTHADSPLFEQSKIDRFERLPPSNLSRRVEQAWLRYTTSVASKAEQTRSWPESQAYWYAAATTLARYDRVNLEGWDQAITRMIMAGARAAGLSLSSDTQEASLDLELAVLCDMSMNTPSTPIHNAIVRGFLLAGTIWGSVYDEAGLSSSARNEFAKALLALAGSQQNLHRDITKARGSHEQFGVAMTDYSRTFAELRKLVDGLADNANLDFLRRTRAMLLRELRRFKPFVPDFDSGAFTGATNILSASVTAYDESAPDYDDEIFNRIVDEIHEGIRKARVVGSHLQAVS